MVRHDNTAVVSVLSLSFVICCPTVSPTHVTVSSLCPRPAHVAAAYEGQSEDWLRIPLPAAAGDRNDTQLIVWGVDVDVETGQLHLPLIAKWLNGRTYTYKMADRTTMGWVRQQVRAGNASCATTDSDGSRSHIEARISHHDPHFWASPPFLTCSLHHFKVPVIVEMVISEADGAVVTLPICTETLPRYYAIVQLKAYISWTIDEVIDFLNYHYLVGFDQVVLHHRWPLTPSDRDALQPYIDSGFLEFHHWPLRFGPRHEVDANIDQDAPILISQMRTREQTQWILAPDMDEYLYINSWAEKPPGRRSCNNSLHCSSPIRDLLDLHRQYSFPTYWTSNYVPFEPPPERQLEADRYRYEPGNTYLPWPVRRIYKREWQDHRALVIAKWVFQPAYTAHFLTHSGGGIRPSWNDLENERLHACHFHRYEHPNVSEFWQKEAVRDSGVSDILEAELWPVGSSQVLLDGIARFKEVRKQRTQSAVKSG